SDGYCQPSCAAGCPDHYTCNGELCSADQTWVAPEPTIVWSGDVSGELTGRDQMTTVAVPGGAAITLTGSAESPVGDAITSLAWTTVSASGDYMYFDDATVETTVPLQAGDYRRVELDVIDDKGRPAHI